MDVMELELGNDGFYAICYQSDTTPDKWEERQKFDKYRLLVRVDEIKRWVFLRSTNIDDIQRCIEEVGHMYAFKPCKNSRKKARDELEITNSKVPTIPQKTIATENNDVSDGLFLGVIIRLSRDFTEQEIKDMLKGFNIYPYEIEKGFTPKFTPYCNIYFKTEEGVGLLCRKLNGHRYKGRNLSVKDANDIL